MARNEDGELELVLGNTQLLSFFFIVVGLLGVFFAMGYLVGRTSAPSLVADAKARDAKPIVIDSPPESPAAVTPPSEAKAKNFETPSPTPITRPGPKEADPVKPVAITTAPQQNVDELPKPEPLVAPTKAEAKAEAKKERPSERKENKKKAKAEKPEKAPAEVAPGKTYLQLSATKRAEAETYVDVLKRKGFIAMAVKVPDKADMYRVLVGPVGDGQINKIRTDLQHAGFPGEKALRKKF